MGCVESTDASEESVQQRLAAKEVEKFLAKERKTEKPLKMLLLGASDSGKSTFRKQFEIINGMMSEDKRAMHKENIHGSMISWMDKATAELRPAEGTPYGIALEEFRQCRTRNRREVDPAMQAALKKLLAMNECTQALTDNINQGAIPANVMYYYEKLDDIAKKDYRPSNEECVALRLTTVGIVELRFNVNGKLLLLVDVGGQRSERKKWFSAFDDVACILYCIALDEFDMNLAEKPDVNRMEESLSIFKDVCNRSEFAKTPFVLLFNKADLLQKKLTALADQKLTGAMQDYEGSVDYKNVLSAIQDKYLSLGDQRDADGKKRDVYPHVTTATQEACVRTVWNSLVDIFTKKNVASAFS